MNGPDILVPPLLQASPRRPEGNRRVAAAHTSRQPWLTRPIPTGTVSEGEVDRRVARGSDSVAARDVTSVCASAHRRAHTAARPTQAPGPWRRAARLAGGEPRSRAV